MNRYISDISPTIVREGPYRLFFFSRDEALRTSSNDILKTFAMRGTDTSAVEVTHVSIHGFWLLLNNEELLMPFAQFPWFRLATIEQISDVTSPTANHLYRPMLDVDLAVDSIRTPEAFPLMAK